MMAEIPRMGLGTVGRTGEAGLEALLAALEIGYRHLDTAQMYGSEENVGAAVRQSGVPRDEVFVTTKIDRANLARAEFLPSLERSLETLGMDRVDLTLIHWPSPGDEVPFEDYMTELAAARERGLTDRIGVSNFPIALLGRAESVLGHGQIATDQVEIHPYLQNRKLVDYCASRGVVPTAYVPIAKGRVADDPVLTRIGQRHDARASQVALAWLLQRDIIAIPASSKPERMRSNFEARNLRLSEAEMAEIAGLDRGERFVAPADGPDWD